MIPALVALIGALLWYFGKGELVTAGIIIFAVGFFHLVGRYSGWSFTTLKR